MIVHVSNVNGRDRVGTGGAKRSGQAGLSAAVQRCGAERRIARFEGHGSGWRATIQSVNRRRECD